MGYMFNKQFRGYNTEEVDETIASLEKNIQDRSQQIRRLEEELKEASELITKAKHNANMILKESMNYVKGLSDEVDGFKDEAKDFRAEIVKISTELLETIDKSEIFSLINEEEKKAKKESADQENL